MIFGRRTGRIWSAGKTDLGSPGSDARSYHGSLKQHRRNGADCDRSGHALSASVCGGYAACCPVKIWKKGCWKAVTYQLINQFLGLPLCCIILCILHILVIHCILMLETAINVMRQTMPDASVFFLLRSHRNIPDIHPAFCVLTKQRKLKIWKWSYWKVLKGTESWGVFCFPLILQMV